MKSKGIYQKEEGALLKKNDKKTAKSGAPKACALNILKRLQKASDRNGVVSKLTWFQSQLKQS